MTTLKKIGLALSTGVLLAAAWPAIGSATPLLFFALVPLFLLERNVYQAQIKNNKKSKLFKIEALFSKGENLLSFFKSPYSY